MVLSETDSVTFKPARNHVILRFFGVFKIAGTKKGRTEELEKDISKTIPTVQADYADENGASNAKLPQVLKFKLRRLEF